MIRGQESRWQFASMKLSACVMASPSLFAENAHAQVVGIPRDEHLTVGSQPNTDKQLLAELSSARRMVDEHPSAKARLSLGRVLKELGEREAALRQFDRALELDPGLSEA